MNFQTPADGIWYTLTVQHGINLMVVWQANPAQGSWALWSVQIFYPNNKQTASIKRLADSLGGHFQYHRDGKLELMTASIINVPERENGYQLNIRIPYRFN